MSSGSDSENYTEEDDNFEDWISDQGQSQACRSLFDDKAFSSAPETLEYDKSTHGFDLGATSKKWRRSFSAFILFVETVNLHHSRTRSSSSDTTDQFHSKACKI